MSVSDVIGSSQLPGAPPPAPGGSRGVDLSTTRLEVEGRALSIAADVETLLEALPEDGDPTSCLEPLPEGDDRTASEQG
jgi:hypothetical protein